MEPQIQYCTTSDGVSIAYWAMGDGPPLVYLPPLAQHTQLDWQLPAIREFYEWLATRHRLVRYDGRNTGLSQRTVEDVSLEARELDLVAVADRLALGDFSLAGHGRSGGLAVAFAAHHPPRVRQLILLDAYVALPGVAPMPSIHALRELPGADWETFTETTAGLLWGWAAGDETRQLAALFRDSMTQEDYLRGRSGFDISGLLGQVGAQTLVVHQRDAIITNIETGRRLAAGIPDARLITLEGSAVYGSYADPVMRAAVDAFLGEDGADPPAAVAEPQRAAGGTVTVLFTDIVGHTEMMQRLGDAKGREVLREHERITRDVLSRHAGEEVKTAGDGFMAAFTSVTAGVECAVALQRAFAERNASAGEPIVVRAGLNAGEPVADGGDYFGSSVILASRIAAEAGAGEILVPDTIRGLLAGKGFLFADRGEFTPKGFEDAVRLYQVRVPE